MKKLVLLILGFILGALAMYFYCQKETPIEMLPPPPKGMITPAEATVLDKAYNERYQLISDSIVTRKGGDNRSSWYALEDVQDFLQIAQSQAKDLGYTMNGVRIYLGAKPTDSQGAGYTTVFMMPTGYLNTSEGNMFNFMFQGGKNDIPGGNGLDNGEDGDPPGANYPQ
ncbi:hypothetical protein AB9K26_07420 [Psychroserpens sp. XS_ASV72]|uniref:hypothetical protein n=1 Tax=Psychroserpens sp. XS_ASV72 TaxID=3241293 RepID=UPI0035133F36